MGNSGSWIHQVCVPHTRTDVSTWGDWVGFPHWLHYLFSVIAWLLNVVALLLTVGSPRNQQGSESFAGFRETQTQTTERQPSPAFLPGQESCAHPRLHACPAISLPPPRTSADGNQPTCAPLFAYFHIFPLVQQPL